MLPSGVEVLMYFLTLIFVLPLSTFVGLVGLV